MEYENLLVKANREKDPSMRFMYVIAFNIAQYKATDGRLMKPFNSILGETFEINNSKFDYIAE